MANAIGVNTVKIMVPIKLIEEAAYECVEFICSLIFGSYMLNIRQFDCRRVMFTFVDTMRGRKVSIIKSSTVCMRR
jgi:hypothetical protein